MTPLQQTAFWKHGDKRRNCSKQAISPFATMFSYFFSKYTLTYRDFLYFCSHVSKVVCCVFVACGIGLRPVYNLDTKLQRHGMFRHLLTNLLTDDCSSFFKRNKSLLKNIVWKRRNCTNYEITHLLNKAFTCLPLRIPGITFVFSYIFKLGKCNKAPLLSDSQSADLSLWKHPGNAVENLCKWSLK